MAIVIPYPPARRRQLVHRCATPILEPAAAEDHLARLTKTQSDAMRRRGVPEHIIAAEVQAFEGAVRAAWWRAVFGGTA